MVDKVALGASMRANLLSLQKTNSLLDTSQLRLSTGRKVRRGVTLAQDVAVPFPSMTLQIDVTTDATSEQMAQLQMELAMYCPIAKLIRASGTVLTEIWTITPTTQAAC